MEKGEVYKYMDNRTTHTYIYIWDIYTLGSNCKASGLELTFEIQDYNVEKNISA